MGQCALPWPLPVLVLPLPPVQPAPTVMVHAWALESKMIAEQARARQQAWAEQMRQHFVRTTTQAEVPEAVPAAEAEAAKREREGTPAPKQRNNTVDLLLGMLQVTESTPPKALKAKLQLSETPVKQKMLWEERGQENSPPQAAMDGLVP